MKKDRDYEDDPYLEDFEEFDIPELGNVPNPGTVSAGEFNRKFQKKIFTPKGKGKYIVAVVLLVLLCSVAAGFGGYRLGYSRSFSQGYDAGYDEGNDLGYNEGMELGKEDGYDVGYDEGYADGADGAKNDAYYGILNSSGQAQTAGSGDVVYCTASGSCYHHEGCSYIAGKSGLKTMSEAEAINSGYSPCSRCGK